MKGLKPVKARNTIFNTSISELMVILIFILLMLFISKIYQQSEDIQLLNEKLHVQEEVLANVVPLSFEQQSDDLLERMRQEIEKRSKSKDFTGDKLLNKFRLEITRLKRENSIQEQLSEREKDELYQKNCVLALDFYNKNNRIPLSEDSPLNKENNLIVNNILLAEKTDINLAGDGNQYDNRLTYNAKGIGKDRFFDNKNIEFRKSNKQFSNQFQDKGSHLSSKNNLAQAPANVMVNNSLITNNINQSATKPKNKNSYLSEIERRKQKARDSKDNRYLQSKPNNWYALNNSQKSELRTINTPSQRYETDRFRQTSSLKTPYKNRDDSGVRVKPDSRITRLKNDVTNRSSKQTNSLSNRVTKPTKSETNLAKTNIKPRDKNNQKIEAKKNTTLPKNVKLATLSNPTGQQSRQDLKQANQTKRNVKPVQNNQSSLKKPNSNQKLREIDHSNNQLKPRDSLTSPNKSKGSANQTADNNLKSKESSNGQSGKNNDNLPEKGLGSNNNKSNQNRDKSIRQLNTPHGLDNLAKNKAGSNLNSNNELNNTGKSSKRSDLNLPEGGRGLNNNESAQKGLKPTKQTISPNGLNKVADSAGSNNPNSDNQLNNTAGDGTPSGLSVPEGVQNPNSNQTSQGGLEPSNQLGKKDDAEPFTISPTELTGTDIQFNPETGLEPRIEQDIINSTGDDNQRLDREKPASALEKKSIFDRIADLFKEEAPKPKQNELALIPLEFKPVESKVPSVIEDDDEFDSFVFIPPKEDDVSKLKDDKKKDKTAEDLKKELIVLLDKLADYIENPEGSNKGDLDKALARIKEIKKKISDLKKESERKACEIEPQRSAN